MTLTRLTQGGLCLTPLALLAQQPAPTPDSAAAAASCAVCSSVLMIPVAILVLNLALLIWVARDAKSRKMDGAVLWMLLVMVTSVFGLLIYLFSRPTGELIPCSSCGNRRLKASATCPHCGHV